jgi:hypothetical protein
MSIQALKESLPELSDEAFERTYRQFALKALSPVLGYEDSQRPRGGSAQKESWDEILDCFEVERERRRNKEITQYQWEGFCKNLGDCSPRNRRQKGQNPG